jgi:two-component system phosphate regulon sensor histidine kinase PhoR
VHLSLYFPYRTKNILIEAASWLGVSVLFLLVMAATFSYTIYSFMRQKKITAMKNDFINNMTHEFKTPISTISIASEVLVGSNDNVPAERLKKYAKIIYDENLRLRAQVEQVLNMAVLDRGSIRLKKSEFDVHEVIRTVVDTFGFENKSRNVSFQLNLNASHSILHADNMHVHNIVNNIIDNGIKYATQKPVIKISSYNQNGGINLEFSDNGIGMTRETIKHIFDKFYRVPKGDVHDVKGFGLGLYYVRQMITAHKGTIKVQSNVNQGSTFTVYLPQHHL